MVWKASTVLVVMRGCRLLPAAATLHCGGAGATDGVPARLALDWTLDEAMMELTARLLVISLGHQKAVPERTVNVESMLRC
jgi:hypothetical protein